MKSARQSPATHSFSFRFFVHFSFSALHRNADGSRICRSPSLVWLCFFSSLFQERHLQSKEPRGLSAQRTATRSRRVKMVNRCFGKIQWQRLITRARKRKRAAFGRAIDFRSGSTGQHPHKTFLLLSCATSFSTSSPSSLSDPQLPVCHTALPLRLQRSLL